MTIFNSYVKLPEGISLHHLTPWVADVLTYSWPRKVQASAEAGCFIWWVIQKGWVDVPRKFRGKYDGVFLDKFSFSVDFPRKAIEIRYGIYDTFFCFDWWQNKALAGKASCFETISDMEVSSHCSSQSKHPFHGMFGKFWGSIFTGPELVLFRTLESCLMSISWYFT